MVENVSNKKIKINSLILSLLILRKDIEIAIFNKRLKNIKSKKALAKT